MSSYLPWLFLAAVVLAACGDDAPACYEGEYAACRCGAAEGYQRCEGESYGVCTCDGTTPGLVATGGHGGGDTLPYMSPCDDDAQCETGLCFPFNAKGPHCSMACGSPDDCPPPSTGCNNMGICKAP
jgi:hypothetical protein